MKVKDIFVLSEIASQKVLLPIGGDEVDFNSIITLNSSAEFLWNLCVGKEKIDIELLQKSLIDEFEIDLETAKTAVNSFITALKEARCLDE